MAGGTRGRVTLPPPPIPLDQHWVAVGQNGSGKSYLIQCMLADWRYANVLALDTKGDSLLGLEKFWPAMAEAGLYVPVFEHLRDLEKFGAGKAIYAPHHTEMKPDYYNAFFELLYERGNTTGWVDEVLSVCRGQVITPFHEACLTRGRSRKVQLAQATQRPMNVPNVIFTESKHFFIFRLLLMGDRKKLAEFCGEAVQQDPEGDYGFWYMGPKMKAPIQVPQGIEEV